MIFVGFSHLDNGNMILENWVKFDEISSWFDEDFNHGRKLEFNGFKCILVLDSSWFVRE